MVKVQFKYRYIIDSDFINWLLEQSDKDQLILMLLRINKNSIDNKSSHILILESEFNKLPNLQEQGFTMLRGCMAVIPDYDYLIDYEDDRVSKNSIFGIDKTDESPFKVRILTSPEKVDEYNRCSHIAKLNTDSVRARSEDIARKIIKKDFQTYHGEKEDSV